MTDSVAAAPRVALDLIRVHPANPRLSALADESMVESIRKLDLLQPLTIAAAPDGDGYILIDGHRRRDGAEKAGLVDVPVHLRSDLVTEAQQIEAMAVTGLQHENLTPVEEAAAYEQLCLLGMDAAAIAAATGFGVRRVKERIKLNTLSADVKAKVHEGEASLADVAALEEFADDPAATTELEQALGTPNFKQTVYVVRGRRERAARRVEQIASFEAAGARLAKSVPGGPGLVVVDGEERRARGMHTFSEDLRDPEVHDGCLAYCIPDYEYADPHLVCIDQAKHPIPVAAAPAPVQSDWEKRQAEREEKRAAQLAATAVRVEWLRGHFEAMFPARSHGALVAAARAGLPLLVINEREAVDSEMLLGALGALPEDRTYPSMYATQESYAATVADAKVGTVLAGFAGYLAAMVADQITIEEPGYLDDVNQVHYALGVWDWMKSAGYPLSDFDKEERTALEVRHTELVAEAESQAS